MNIILLLLAVSVFCLGYGLWLGYGDLRPVCPNAAAASTSPELEIPICDRANPRLAVGCSLLLHAGIITVLLLVGDVPPGIRRIPGTDPSAKSEEFYVFLASFPDEKKHPAKASRNEKVRSPLQAAIPTFFTLTATRVVPQPSTKHPTGQRPAPVQVAGFTKGGPPTPAPQARDEASPEVEKPLQRKEKSSQVQGLTRVAEQLERLQSLPSLREDGGPDVLHARPGAILPASQIAPNPASVPMPGGSAVGPTQAATRLTSEGAPDPPRTSVPDDPALFPPPGMVVGEKIATSTSPMDNGALDRRGGKSLGLPLVTAAARPTAHEPPGRSRDTHSAEAQTRKLAPSAEPAKDAGPPYMPQTHAPTFTFFPSPGTIVAAPDPTVPLPVQRTAPRAPAPKSAGAQQETKLAKVEASKTLPVSPTQQARSKAPLHVSPPALEGEPVANRLSITGPSLQEPKEVPDIRFGSALPSEPPATRQGTHSAEEETQGTLAAATPIQEATARVERRLSAGIDLRKAEGTPVAKFGGASAAPEVAPQPYQKSVPDGLAVAAQPVEAVAALFPSPGTVVEAQSATPPSPGDRAAPPRGQDAESGDSVRVLASVSRTPEQLVVGQGVHSAKLKAFPAPPIQQVAPRQSMSQEAPPSAGAKPLPEPAPFTDADHAGFPSPGTMIVGGSSAPDRIPPGSAEGRGFGRLAVRLDGPRSRVANHEIQTVSGKILGGVPVELALHVNGTAREVVADGGSFQVSVSLRRGPNLLRVVAKDWRGIETEDSIAVTYVPPPVPNGIAITGPGDGYILPSDAPPVILVEGRVEDWNVSTVWLVANGRRIAVQAHDGRFHKALPALDRVLHLWAELPASNGSTHRSRSVTVRNPSPSRSHGLLLLDWPEGVVDNQVEVKATWRESPARLDVPIRGVPIEAFGTSTKETLPEIFSLRMKPGVYTFVLRARGISASGVRATLILPQGDHLKGRELKPVSLNGAREVVLAKVLLPQGVLWGDDEWFTGQSESADSVTKFRFPEGISWTERKKDLQ